MLWRMLAAGLVCVLGLRVLLPVLVLVLVLLLLLRRVLLQHVLLALFALSCKACSHCLLEDRGRRHCQRLLRRRNFPLRRGNGGPVL
jgi:hypothetical protein